MSEKHLDKTTPAAGGQNAGNAAGQAKKRPPAFTGGRSVSAGLGCEQQAMGLRLEGRAAAKLSAQKASLDR